MKSFGRRTTEDLTAPVFILREIHHLYVALHEGAEIQQQFDAYRAETGVDSVRLREDAVAAQRERISPSSPLS
jgi:hypothetical protein